MKVQILEPQTKKAGQVFPGRHQGPTKLGITPGRKMHEVDGDHVLALIDGHLQVVRRNRTQELTRD